MNFRYLFLFGLLYACSMDDPKFSDEIIKNQFEFPDSRKIGTTQNISWELDLQYFNLIQVEFLNSSESFWVFGKYSTLSSGDNSKTLIYHSADSGVYNLSFTVDVGYPSYFETVNNKGLLLTSSDKGGELWLTSNIQSGDWKLNQITFSGQGISEIGMIDSETIFYRKGRRISLSEDFGNTWTEFDGPGDQGEILTKLFFINKSKIFATTSDTEIYNSYPFYTSSNQGATWELISQEDFMGERIGNIHLLESGRGFLTLSGSGSSQGNILYETTDSGYSWSPIGKTSFDNLGQVYMFEDGRGLMYNGYKLFYTRDFGKTIKLFFNRPEVDDTYRINTLRPINDSTFIIPIRDIYEFTYSKQK